MSELERLRDLVAVGLERERRLVEQLQAAEEAAQKNWDAHVDRQLMALDQDPERKARLVVERERDGLLEQLDALREALVNVTEAQSYVVDAPDGHPSIIVRTADEALEEAVGVARTVLARYPASES